MRDVVALAFDDLHARTGRGAISCILGNLKEGAAPLHGLCGVFLEVIEKGLFSRQETHVAGCIAEPGRSVNLANVF
jgi:hypothetical protein